MTNHARNGRAREHRVRDHLVQYGWHTVARSAGSKGAADLVMVHAEAGLALVQVGTPGKTLGPADRARLITLADLASALPLVAIAIKGVGIRYRIVTPGPPRTWDEYDPTTLPRPQRQPDAGQETGQEATQ